MGHPLLDLLKPRRADDPLSLRRKKRRRIGGTSLLVIGLTSYHFYHVGTQIAPGQQQYDSMVERIARDHRGINIRDVIAVNSVVFITSGTTFLTPATWNNGSNTIEAIGGGAGGRVRICICGFFAGAGGGGGGYAKGVNITLSGTVPCNIGSAGPSNGPGGDTTVNTSVVIAKGAASNVGGIAGTPSTGSHTGGNGGGGVGNAGSGGGGAAGPNGNGNNGVTGGASNGGVGGSADAGLGGAGGTAGTLAVPGGNGGAGTEYTATAGGTAGSGGGGGGGGAPNQGGAGGLYGGGGGSAGTGVVTSALGNQGIIILTWLPFNPLAGAVPDTMFLTSRKYRVVAY